MSEVKRLGSAKPWRIVIEYDPTKRGRAEVKYFNLTKRSEAMLVLRKAVRELQRSLGRHFSPTAEGEVETDGRTRQGVRRATGSGGAAEGLQRAAAK